MNSVPVAMITAPSNAESFGPFMYLKSVFPLFASSTTSLLSAESLQMRVLDQADKSCNAKA